MNYSGTPSGAKGGSKKGGYVGDSGIVKGVMEPHAPTNGKGSQGKMNYTDMK
jgi:hypothetical protein